MIVRGIESLPVRPVVAATFGNFDGVHRGHRQILAETRSAARALDGTAGVVTFEPHPMELFRPGHGPEILTPFQEKAELLLEAGADLVLRLDFTEELARIGAEEFLERILADALGARTILVGWDARFGSRGTGDVQVLDEWGRKTGREVRVVPPICRDGSPVSSTRVRREIRRGDVEAAEQLLGRTFVLRGGVAPGRRVGSELGYGTANLELSDRLLPGDGIYATLTRQAPGAWRPSVTYVGVRPTFGAGCRIVETHILEHQGELYGQVLEVAFLARLREDRTFRDPEELGRQIARDIEDARRIHRVRTAVRRDDP